MTGTPVSTGSWWRSGRTKAIVALFVTLFVGIAIGAALDRALLFRPWWGPHRPPFGWRQHGFSEKDGQRMRERMRQHMVKELKLDSAQSVRLDSIMSQRAVAFRAMRAENETRVRAMIDSTNAVIDSILTPEQRERFKAMRARFRGPGHPGDHGGPRGPGEGIGMDGPGAPPGGEPPARHAP